MSTTNTPTPLAAQAGSTRDDLVKMERYVRLVKSALIVLGQNKSADLMESARCYLVAARNALRDSSNTTNGTRPAPARPGSAVWEAWNGQAFEDRYKGDPESFRIGWEAAMRSIWDRLPAPDYARDPMTPREVGKLLDYVRANLPNTQASDGSNPYSQPIQP